MTNAELLEEMEGVLDRWLRLTTTWADRERALAEAASFFDMAALVAHQMPDSLPNYPAWHLSQTAKHRASAVFADAIGVAYATDTPPDSLAKLRQSA